MHDHVRKAKFVLESIIREQSISADSPIIRAGKEIGVGRTVMSRLVNNPDACLKDTGKIVSLDRAYGKRVAEPGSVLYRRRWVDIVRRIDATSIGELDLYLVEAAYGHWADIAVDERQSDATRLLYGRLAEFVLYNWLSSGSRRTKDAQQLPGATDDDIRARGLSVIDSVAAILARNPVAPEGFYEVGGDAKEAPSPVAKAAGYRMFRIRMLSDQIGWGSTIAKGDIGRAELYARAYHGGLAADLVWLHSIYGRAEIAYSNNAWNLAIHAGDWATSVRYASLLFAAFPQFMAEKVMKLTAVREDRTLWPGIAALLVRQDDEYNGLARVREQLESGDAAFAEMMEAVRKMVPLVRENHDYLTVLNMGASK